MKIVIPGNPIAKARHKRARRGNLIVDYDPQQKEKEALSIFLIHEIQAAFSSEKKEIVMQASNLAYAAAYSLSVVSYCPIADSSTDRQKNAKLWGLELHTQKPDGSNLLKFIEDCANKILYKDDAMIVEGTFKKVFSSNPRTEVVIMPIKLNTNNDVKNILTVFRPKEIAQMCEEMQELCNYSGILTSSHFWESYDEMNMHCKKNVQNDLARLISLFADKYSKKLTQVHKKCPGFHTKYEELCEKKNQLNTSS